MAKHYEWIDSGLNLPAEKSCGNFMALRGHLLMQLYACCTADTTLRSGMGNGHVDIKIIFFVIFTVWNLVQTLLKNLAWTRELVPKSPKSESTGCLPTKESRRRNMVYWKLNIFVGSFFKRMLTYAQVFVKVFKPFLKLSSIRPFPTDLILLYTLSLPSPSPPILPLKLYSFNSSPLPSHTSPCS
jgi:hypothetical protein